MEKYTVLIALAYFNEKKEKYTIQELAKTLGYTRTRIDELTFHLLSNGYIEYVDNLLKITKKGLTFLIANEMENFSLATENINMIHINPGIALSVTDPYVPKDFTKKYNG